MGSNLLRKDRSARSVWLNLRQIDKEPRWTECSVVEALSRAKRLCWPPPLPTCAGYQHGAYQVKRHNRVGFNLCEYLTILGADLRTVPTSIITSKRSEESVPKSRRGIYWVRQAKLTLRLASVPDMQLVASECFCVALELTWRTEPPKAVTQALGQRRSCLGADA